MTSINHTHYSLPMTLYIKTKGFLRRVLFPKHHAFVRKALLDPSSVFKTPNDILKSTELNHEEKMRILRRWEYDARELAVAEEENMQGSDNNMLEAVLKAQIALGGTSCRDHSAPTKHGGE